MKELAKFQKDKYVVFLFSHPSGYFEIRMFDGNVCGCDYFPTCEAGCDHFSHITYMLLKEDPFDFKG